MTVQWYGEDVKKETAELVSTKIRQATFLVQGHAIDNVPVDTGRLKGSIDTEITDTKGVVYTNVDYAIYVETGSENPNYPAQPFLRSALIKNEKNIEAIFRS